MIRLRNRSSGIIGATMVKDVSKPIVEESLAEKGKHLSRGQRIHRRRMLALQRSRERTQAVTLRG